MCHHHDDRNDLAELLDLLHDLEVGERDLETVLRATALLVRRELERAGVLYDEGAPCGERLSGKGVRD